MWMSGFEIDQTARRLQGTKLEKYAHFLWLFADEVNANSDGWYSWRAPSRAAEKLMTLLDKARPGSPEPSETELKKSLTPIKSFMTRRGYAAGMKMPEVR